MVGKRKPVVESELAVRSQQPSPTLEHSSTQTKLTNERPDEPRRSGRATKGQHTKNHEEAPPPSKKKGKGKGSKAATSEAEENGDDEAIVRCICGDTEDYRGWMMIVCEQCEAWQHNFCMGVPEDDAQLPDQYYCEQCRPQNHKELVEAMRRGEKPWEEKIRRREEEENQKKKKGSRKSKGARASGVSADHQDASPRGSATPAAQLETVGKRKAVGIEIPVAPVNPRVSKGSQRKEANSGGQQMSPVTSHPPHPASPIGQRRKSTFDENPLKRRKSVVDDTAAKRRKSGAEGSLARRDSITLPPVDSLDQLPKERQGVANALQKSIKDLIDGSVKHNTYRVPDGQTPTVLATELALKIEYALYQRFPSEEEKSTYAEQFRSISFNIKKNKSLFDDILSGSLSPEELAGMSSDDMASEELQRERARLKEQADKQAVLLHDDGPRYKKTHKGEELIGGFDGARSMEMALHAASAATGSGSPTQATNGDDRAPLAVDTTAVTHDRKSSANFDIQQVFSAVRSPEVAQGAFSQPVPRAAAPVAPPKHGPGEDADIDRLLKDEDMTEALAELPEGEAVWRGSLTMQGAGGAQFSAFARYAGGIDLSHHIPYEKLLPQNLEIHGRIAILTADDYVAQHRYSTTTDVSVLQLVPFSGPSDPGLESIFNYLKSKERWGVIKNPDLHPDVRDLYVVLVEEGMSPLPKFMQLLEDMKIETPRPTNGLYLAMLVKTKQTPPPTAGADGVTATKTELSSMLAAAPEATPVAAMPANANTLPPAELGYEPGALARKILGHYVTTTTVRQLCNGVPNMSELQLTNLKDILDRDPAARDDISALSRHLYQRAKEQGFM